MVQRYLSSAGLPVCLVWVCGCGTTTDTAELDAYSSSGLWGDYTVGDVEPNDDFAAAVVATLSDSVHLTGSITSSLDKDVYDLGVVSQHTLLQARLESHNTGSLTACLFDGQQRLLNRSTVSSPGLPRVLDWLVPEGSQNLYLLVCAPSSESLHGYSATLSVRNTGLPLEPRPQVVLLNFIGASDLTVAGRFYPDVPIFDAGSIDGRFAGMTQGIVDLLLQKVREDYAGLGVQVYLATDPAVPAGPFSVVHFGGSNPDLLGVADGVDPYNAKTGDTAIVYTDTFTLFNPLNLGEAAMAQVLANVASHEIGHLLGLRHTEDTDDIMDITASARRLSGDQWFKKSRLHAAVAPLGYQDSPTMLAWAVGGQLNAPPVFRHARPLTYDGEIDFEIPRTLLCGHCAAPEVE